MEAGYHQSTRNIEIDVQPFFLEDQSDPEECRFVWAYQVTIRNAGPETVQLLRRSWRITDAHGQVMQVEGAGVVGEQPVLEPGEVFQYTSGTPLSTPSGFMGGSYQMVCTASGEPFVAAVPTFSLDSPHGAGAVN